MRAVITGNSYFALELTKLLLEEKQNKITIIIKKKEDAIAATEKLGIGVVNADPSNPKTLDDLELEKCDIFISATDSEKDNLLSAAYAKSKGVQKIFVLVDKEDSGDILEKLGFIPIPAEQFAARTVELMISRPAVSDLVNLGIGEFDIIEAEAKNTSFIGKELGSAKGKYFTALSSYSNGNYVFSKEEKIKENDKIIFIVNTKNEKAAQKEIFSKSKLKF